MKTFSPALEAEIKYQLEDVDYEEEENRPSRNQVIRYLMEDMDDPNHYASEFKKELQDFGIEIGIFKAHTKADLDNIYVTSGKKYDFKRKNLYYCWESWQPLEESK